MSSAPYNISCPPGVIAGRDMTKEMRHEIFGISIAGGAGSTKMEDFQRKKVEEGTAVPCATTTLRIHRRTYLLHDNANPMTQPDGYEYTEDLDGLQLFTLQIGLILMNVYLNFKSVVGPGGAQTRTLRDECYAFILAQLNTLLLRSYSHVPTNELISRLPTLKFGSTECNRTLIVLNARSNQIANDSANLVAPLPLNIDKMTSAELKKECKDRKIAVSGNKQELIDRIKAHGTPKKNMISDNDHFANIFDGDNCSKADLQFDYLMNDPIYADVKKYVYVGDLKGYFEWLKAIVC